MPLIEKPSRYLGYEINSVKKDSAKVKLKIALAFPDLYEIGTSHFGIQILYYILNQHPDIAAERVFAPGKDMESALRASGVRLPSMETRQALNTFDIVGFSLLYELNYTNILTMLSLSEIPFYAAQREEAFPLVIAGGPCTCNPEPVADFFDAMVVGDGESVIMQMADIWLSFKQEGRLRKADILAAWSKLDGVYVPMFYQASYNEKGFQITTPRRTEAPRPSIKRAIIASLNEAPFPEAPVVPFGKPVHDRLRLEISRGCTRGCRFCQAGMIYRPVRERSVKQLLNLTHTCLQHTGYEDISVLSLSTGDYTQITPLIHRLIQTYASENIAVSLPSLRAGTLTPDVMSMIKRVRKTGFTIAPEAGSQRLRNVINKNISETEILETVTNAFSLGWQVMKLYFMLGLPTETQADLDAMVDLVKALRKTKTANGRPGKITVSVATFIPKPHTPFQWASQLSLEDSEERIAWLKAKLKLPGVQFKWQNPAMSFLEGIWARGDRRFSRLLVNAYQHHCRFDGWSDHFNFQQWQTSLAESQIDPHFYTTRKRDLGEPLPWDHIDVGVNKTFLKKEWARALTEKRTGDCRWQACHQCGVCDFQKISPDLSEDDITTAVPEAKKDTSPQPAEDTVCIVYSKTGEAKFFGHLEMVNIFLRALRRVSVPIKYSGGFHPLPKVSFEDPLPIGMQSTAERFYITVLNQVDTKKLMLGLNKALPAGLRVKACRRVAKKRSGAREKSYMYVVTREKGSFKKERVDQFHRQPVFNLTRTNKKGGTRSIDLKKFVFRLDLIRHNSLSLGIKHLEGKTVRPHEILSAVFGFSELEIKKATIIKGQANV